MLRIVHNRWDANAAALQQPFTQLTSDREGVVA
jgi:hypothetical protein